MTNNKLNTYKLICNEQSFEKLNGFIQLMNRCRDSDNDLVHVENITADELETTVRKMIREVHAEQEAKVLST